ncbi:MAG: SLBB domain-containing protein, partial [Chthoniobacterales bacterium]
TVHYMAPEQIEHPQEVDHRADIYSLGVVFYQMLTGELPLGRFAPPSQKVQIDVRLDEVILKALEKEPNRRYSEVSELKTQVTTIAEHPVEAIMPPTEKVKRPIPPKPEVSPLPPRLSLYALLGTIFGIPLFIPIGFFTMPLCGFLALRQIRLWSGRVYGVRLALFDILFPILLVLDVLIFGGFVALSGVLPTSIYLPAIIALGVLVIYLSNALFIHLAMCRAYTYLNDIVSRERRRRQYLWWENFRKKSRIVMSTFLVVIIASIVIAPHLSRKYKSTATVKVEANFPREIYAAYPADMSQIIKRQNILFPVIDSMQLCRKWKKSSAAVYLRLLNMVDAQSVPNTDLIRISVTDANSDEAAALANAIALEYQQMRNTLWKKSDHGEKAMREQIEIQRKKAEDLQQEMIKAGLEVSSDSNQDFNNGRYIAELQRKVFQQKQETDALKAKQTVMSSLSDDKLIEGLKGLEIADSGSGKIWLLYQKALAQKAELALTYPADHPVMRDMERQMQTHQQQVKIAADTVRRGFKAKIEVSELYLGQCQKELDDAQKASNSILDRMRKYEGVQERYNRVQGLITKLEQAQQNSDGALKTATPPVSILTKAESESTPVTPHFETSILWGIVIGLLALIVGIAASYWKWFNQTSWWIVLPGLIAFPVIMFLLVYFTIKSHESRALPKVKNEIKATPEIPNRVSVGGAVKKPGFVTDTRDMTVRGAIFAAGGFTEFADSSKVRLIRDGKASTIDLKKLQKQSAYTPHDDPPLQPGDIIDVP